MGATTSCGCAPAPSHGLRANAKGSYDVAYVDSLGVHGPKGVSKVKTGRNTRSVTLDDKTPERNLVKCPDGHVMRAHVAREMFVMCEGTKECDDCDENITSDVSRYQCKQCDCVYCNSCAREHLGLECEGRKNEEVGDPVELMPGDIFLCGPDKWGIHHVILATGGWHPADDEVFEALELEPGTQLLACSTIESTQGSVGEETWWYPSTSFFTRNPYTGEAFLVADIPPRSSVLHAAIDPVPMKVLLHPFRPGSQQGPLETDTMEEVINELAEHSRKYGKFTAVSSMIAGLVHKEVIDPADYKDDAQRAKLLDKIRLSWSRRPICASVAVKCWQKYFDLVHESDGEVLDAIFQHMPHWCHLSTPSALVKGLSDHGWVLQDHLD